MKYKFVTPIILSSYALIHSSACSTSVFLWVMR